MLGEGENGVGAGVPGTDPVAIPDNLQKLVLFCNLKKNRHLPKEYIFYYIIKTT